MAPFFTEAFVSNAACTAESAVISSVSSAEIRVKAEIESRIAATSFFFIVVLPPRIFE